MRGIWEGSTRKQMNHWQSGGKVVPIPDDFIDISNFEDYLWGITNGEENYYMRGGYSIYSETSVNYRSGSWFSDNAKTYCYKKNNTYYGIKLFLSEETKMLIVNFDSGTADIPEKEIIPWVTYWFMECASSIPKTVDYEYSSYEEMKKAVQEKLKFNKIAVPNGYNKIITGEFDNSYKSSRYSFMTSDPSAPFISNRQLVGNYNNLYLASYKPNWKQSGVLNKKLFTGFNTISYEPDVGGLRLTLGINDFPSEELIEGGLGVLQHHWHSGYSITRFTKKV